ncbi:MAG: NAD(P)H-dependent oxidoreductase subunit E [Dehalococcoidales bacterium]|nr:NAD(P)H-dependent oxidoreductase subunit E [Dehalococcoidales bacterium]
MGAVAGGVRSATDESIVISAGKVFREIQEIIKNNKDKAGGLIRVLQQVQELFGYLPAPIIRGLSRDMKVPLSEVYGIVSFYGFFSMVPKGKYIIQVCTGTSCYVKGANKLLDTLKKDWGLEPDGITEDGRFSLETIRCLGACGLSPVMSVGGEIHGKVKASKLNEILQTCE